MKPVPILRLLIYAAVFGGGVFTQRLLAPPASASGGTSQSKESSAASNAPVTVTMGKGAKGLAFDGTLGGLYRMAKAARSRSRARRHLAAALQEAPSTQIATLMEEFPKKSDLEWYEDAVHHTLLQLWAEKDAPAAFKWAAGLPRNRASLSRMEILEQLAADDPQKAVAYLRTITNHLERRNAITTLTPVLSETDPEQALEMLESLGLNRVDGNHATVFRAWALRDPEEAWQRALSLPRGSRSLAIQAVMSVRAASDPRGALALALGLPTEGSIKNNSVATVFSVWAQEDPAKAHAAALALTNAGDRNAAMNSVIYHWTQTDPMAALHAVEAMPQNATRRGIIDNIYQTWATQDPLAAAASLRSSSLSPAQKSSGYANVAQAWAQQDPAAALQWAKELPSRQSQSNAIGCVLGVLGSQGGQAALAAWRSLPADMQRDHLQTLVGTWAYNEPGGALAFARTIENPRERALALASCATSTGFSNPAELTAILNEIPAQAMRINAIKNMVSDPFGGVPDEMLQWMRTLPESDRTAVLRDTNFNWSNSSPAEMKALLAETPALTDRPDLWAGTATSMANDDPAAALAWAQSIESPAARRQSVQETLRIWAENDPGAAMVQALTLTDGETQKSAMNGIIDIWAGQDPDALMAWAATAEGEEREIALLKASLAKSANDPAESAKVVSGMLAAQNGEKLPVALTSAVSQLAQTWFQQDPDASAHWVAQLPEGPAREDAAGVIAGQWSNMDPVAASAWVQQLSAGDSRDAAVAALCQGICIADPESAFTWALSIADTEKREQAIRTAADAWRGLDKSAALAAITGASMPETLRAGLLKKIERQE